MKYRQFTEKELKWINQFKKIMLKAPNTLFMFVGSGITILVKDENNNRYLAENSGGAMDGMAPNIHISTSLEADGGDW
jgi:hypothetical protein